MLKSRILGEAPLIFKQVDDAVTGVGGLPVFAHDLMDIGDGHQRIRKARPARLAFQGPLVEFDRLPVIAFFRVILRGFKQADEVLRMRGDQFKAQFVRALAGGACAVGNGFNDINMFDEADLSIAVLEGEGMCAALLPHADVMVRSIAEGLDLLLKPDRLRADLRT